MKELICDAYERGLLIAVVPFVAKILDAASASRVFMPPNPWVMGIMMVLVELYQVPDLKLNLKFEIEVLAKTLKVELTEVMSSKRLAMRTQDRTQTCDFANRAGALAAGLGGGLTSGFGGGLARARCGRGRRHVRRGRRRRDGDPGLRSVRRLGAAVWRADVRGPARVLRAGAAAAAAAAGVAGRGDAAAARAAAAAAAAGGGGGAGGAAGAGGAGGGQQLGSLTAAAPPPPATTKR